LFLIFRSFVALSKLLPTLSSFVKILGNSELHRKPRNASAASSSSSSSLLSKSTKGQQLHGFNRCLEDTLRFNAPSAAASNSGGGGGASGGGGKKGKGGGGNGGGGGGGLMTALQQDAVFATGMELLGAGMDVYR
jgi:hypothetical protein